MWISDCARRCSREPFWAERKPSSPPGDINVDGGRCGRSRPRFIGREDHAKEHDADGRRFLTSSDRERIRELVARLQPLAIEFARKYELAKLSKDLRRTIAAEVSQIWTIL